MAAANTVAAAGTLTGAATKPALETDANAATESLKESLTGAAAYSENGLAADDSPAADASEVGQIKASLEKRRKMFLVTALEGALNATLEGNELSLEFAPDARHLRDTLAKSENVKILREVGKEVTGRDLGVRFVITDTAVPQAPASKEETERRDKQLDKQQLREQAEKDPTVQQMLRTFRGEIVDVKRVDGKN
jgi:hypothetical protein